MTRVSGLQKLGIFLDAIRVEHTIFALPFAYVGMVLAARGWPTAWQVFWITLAMVGGRTAAMSLNRLIDREIDARNPRTANRALPQGLLSVRFMWVAAVLSLALLAVSAALLNPLCLQLAPLAIIWLVGYSYTKRFTWLSHFALGLADAIAPMGGWIAVTGTFAWETVLLGAAVGIWIAGFDIIYACQDYEVDQREGLHAIPARFGIPTALWVSSLCHLTTVLLLVLLGLHLTLGLFYWIGVLAAALLLLWEHLLVNPRDLSKLHIAFFHVNSSIAGVLFFFTLLDVL